MPQNYCTRKMLTLKRLFIFMNKLLCEREKALRGEKKRRQAGRSKVEMAHYVSDEAG